MDALALHVAKIARRHPEQGFRSCLGIVRLGERYGAERITISSACDWGPSVPTAVPQLMLEMRRRGHSEELIRKLVFENPLEFLMQSGKFELPRLGIHAQLRQAAFAD